VHKKRKKKREGRISRRDQIPAQSQNVAATRQKTSSLRQGEGFNRGFEGGGNWVMKCLGVQEKEGVA